MTAFIAGYEFSQFLAREWAERVGAKMTNYKNHREWKKTCVSAASNVYDASVGARALSRAGHCPQLKGIVHEIMFCDKTNLTPGNLIRGCHMELTKSTTAKMKDVVAVNRVGHVTAHAQVKDTVSHAGVRKTVGQMMDGHYGKTKIFGTEETTKAVNDSLKRAGGNPRMQSTGISSKTTARIADKALGNMPSFSTCMSAAKTGGMVGAALGAGFEVVNSILDDSKSMEETCEDVVFAAAKGGVVGAASGVIGTAAAGVTGVAMSAAASTSVGSAILGTAVGSVAVGAAPLIASVAVPVVVLGACGESLMDAGAGAVEVVADGVVDGVESAADFIDDVGSAVVDAVVGGMADGAETAFDLVDDVGSAVADGVVEGVEAAADLMDDVGSAVVDGVADGVEAAFDLIDDVGDFLGGFFD